MGNVILFLLVRCSLPSGGGCLSDIWNINCQQFWKQVTSSRFVFLIYCQYSNEQWVGENGFWSGICKGRCLPVARIISVSERWMNKYGTLVEWHWQGNWSARRKTLYSVGSSWMIENGALVEWHWQGNWSAGRKTLYSVGGRWMNDYGTLVEWYWQGKLKYWEKNIIQRWW